MSNAANEIERVKEVKITRDGETYTLDFSRESAVFAQNHGFIEEDLYQKPTIAIPVFFYFALRKNHKRIAKNQADEIFERFFPDGLPSKVLGRLVSLYQQAALTSILTDDEDFEKNSQTVVEM